jgi:hypothetical protein
MRNEFCDYNKWTAIKTDAAEQADGLCSLPDGQISGEPVQPRRQKYSASRFAQINLRTSAVPSRKRGGSRSSRTRGGMRWTLMCL